MQMRTAQGKPCAVCYLGTSKGKCAQQTKRMKYPLLKCSY